jgi:hypothetical protein
VVFHEPMIRVFLEKSGRCGFDRGGEEQVCGASQVDSVEL